MVKAEGSEIFFKWPKQMIIDKHWASIKSASKTILPVITVHSNEQNICRMGKEKIAELSGCKERTVYDGINDLKEKGFLKIKKYKTNRMDWFGNEYDVVWLRKYRGGYFPFYKSLVDNGNWGKLKPSAKALYPVMRCFGYNRGYGANDEEYDVFSVKIDIMEEYAGKTILRALESRNQMAEYAEIDRGSIQKSALKSLQQAGLINPYKGKSSWKVYCRTKHSVW